MEYRVELTDCAGGDPGYLAIYEIDEANSVVYVLTIPHGAMDEARPDDLS